MKITAFLLSLTLTTKAFSMDFYWDLGKSWDNIVPATNQSQPKNESIQQKSTEPKIEKNQNLQPTEKEETKPKRENYKIIYRLGKFSPERINEILAKANRINDYEKKIEFLSAQFLGVPYERLERNGEKKRKLDPKKRKENLIVKLANVDCMTYIEYLEALNRSKNFDDFVNQLKNVRYKNGVVSYETRNHFFTDWIKYNGYVDYAKKLAPKRAIVVRKHINYSSKEGVMLEGVPVETRVFSYIPSHRFTKDIINKLKTGDLVGAYAWGRSRDWIDVTHVGIIVKKNGRVYFRNASSLRRYNGVVDIPLEQYLKRVKGLVILRKKENID